MKPKDFWSGPHEIAEAVGWDPTSMAKEQYLAAWIVWEQPPAVEVPGASFEWVQRWIEELIASEVVDEAPTNLGRGPEDSPGPRRTSWNGWEVIDTKTYGWAGQPAKGLCSFCTTKGSAGSPTALTANADVAHWAVVANTKMAAEFLLESSTSKPAAAISKWAESATSAVSGIDGSLDANSALRPRMLLSYPDLNPHRFSYFTEIYKSWDNAGTTLGYTKAIDHLTRCRLVHCYVPCFAVKDAREAYDLDPKNVPKGAFDPFATTHSEAELLAWLDTQRPKFIARAAKAVYDLPTALTTDWNLATLLTRNVPFLVLEDEMALNEFGDGPFCWLTG